jgi:hypothetical protein
VLAEEADRQRPRMVEPVENRVQIALLVQDATDASR